MNYEELQLFKVQLHKLGFANISGEDLALAYQLLFDPEKGDLLWESMPGHKIPRDLSSFLVPLSLIAKMFQYRTIKTFARVIEIVINHGLGSIMYLTTMTEEELRQSPVLNEITDLVCKERGHMLTNPKKMTCMTIEETYEDLQVDAVMGNAQGFKVLWSSARKGYGEVTFIYADDGMTIDHEYMSKEFCVALMTKLIEKYYV